MKLQLTNLIRFEDQCGCIYPKIINTGVKKILKTSFFVFSFLALFYSNTFAFLEFKQEKDISTDTKAVNGFDLKMSSNYNFLSDVPDYGANIEISNKF